ncbi:hypothetical protein ACIQSO_22015 [Pseudomonas putida]|uniref:hypothetical protein n=1 Tax=Pseudomonas putida TaxID=303 RepID=UPI00383A9597
MTSESRFLTAGVLSSTSGQVDIDLKTGSIVIKGPTGSTVIGSLESGDVQARIEGEDELESLKLSGVTLYGDLAVKVREVQAILAAHGAGELKLVKAKSEGSKDYIVVDGQVFINQAAVDGLAGAMPSFRVQVNSQGEHVAAGICFGERRAESNVELIEALSSLINPLKLKITEPADRIRQVIRDELKPGGMLHRG